MGTDLPSRLRDLFDAALAQPAADRLQFLRKKCAGEPTLFAQVAELIELHEEVSIGDHSKNWASNFASETPQSPSAEDSSGWLGQIGSYRLIRQIGEGGMGIVYEAEQASPRRLVAVKVVRHDVLSHMTIDRFERESATLGLLEHEGIARIYEAGSSAINKHAVPFLAMELVYGERLDLHAAQKELSLRARLELMARVAEAAHYAHERGVVHLDLKPANILVDSNGNPKILDFGISTITGSVRRENPFAHYEVAGTLRYMSPEQTLGRLDLLDARADVYALGLITYELVAGRPAYDVSGLDAVDAFALIRRAPPSRIEGLPFICSADVNAILSEALRKDRTARYATAHVLAEDLRAICLGKKPSAGPDSVIHSIRRWTGREERIGHAGAGVAVICSLGALFNLVYLMFGIAQNFGGPSLGPDVRYWEFMANMTAWTASLAALAGLGHRVARGSRSAMWVSLIASVLAFGFCASVLAGYPYDAGGALKDPEMREGLYTIFAMLGLTSIVLIALAFWATYVRQRLDEVWDASSRQVAGPDED